MSWTLFKSNIRSNRFIFLLISLIFFFYMAIIMTLYDPDQIDALNEMLAMMPETMIRAMNFSTLGNTLLTFISDYIYGFLVFLFPMIMVITINHRLVAVLVDRGSMAFLLASPLSRKKIILTQMAFSIVSVSALFFLNTLFSILLANRMFPGELELGKFILINLYALIMYYAISSICFFASTIAQEAKTSLSIGVGVPVGFLVLQMLGNADDSLSFIGNLSLYALFDPSAVILGTGFMVTGMVVLFSFAVVFYGLSGVIFIRKNLYV